MYNEGKRVDRLISSIEEFLEVERPYQLQFFAIDDGSVDGCHEKIANNTRHIELIRYAPNKGKGFAIRYGLRAILENHSFDYVGFTDADLATPLSDIDKIYHEILKIEQPEFIIGNRNVSVRVYQNIFRRLISKTFNFIAHIPLMYKYSDTQAGFKFYKNSFASKIVQHCVIDHFAFDIEHLMLAELLKVQIREFPIANWTHGEHSTVSPLQDGIKMFKDAMFLKFKVKENIQHAINSQSS